MATTAILPIHVGKGRGSGNSRAVATALGISINYVTNPEKTNGGELITAYECDPMICDAEFAFSKNQYAILTGRDQGARDVIGYHLRISFAPGETDAATANRIGYDLAMKLTRANHAFICCTHTDRRHVHSHIVINSTSLDCTKKFRNFKGSAFAIRKIADHLCVENGLSIITNPKQSRGSYAKWQSDERQPSNREKLKQIIDTALENAKDFDGFIAAMKASGCEVKHNKNLSFKIPGAERFARCSSLGDDYTEETLIERLTRQRKVVNTRLPAATPEPAFVAFAITSQTRFSYLIDIQKKIQEGKGEAYQNWAHIYNLKQAAKTLIYLQENGIGSYDELTEKATATSLDFNSRTKRLREIDERQKAISEMQKQIGSYGKTRDIYAKYKASGWDRGFYDIHATDIILHRAAKKYFNDLGYGKGKKLPSINMLKQEWATMDSEKKSLLRGYKELKDHRMNLLVAKDTCQRLLGINQDAPERAARHEQKRDFSR